MTPGSAVWTTSRLAEARDLDQVVALAEASFVNGWTKAMFLRDLERSEAAPLFVVRSPDGEVAGYCATWLLDGELHINGLAIAPAERRRGAASALVRHALDEGRRLGALEALLEVRRSNRAARRLYESAGFTIRGVRPRYYVRPVDDAVIMGRHL